MKLFIGHVPVDEPRVACRSFNIRYVLFVCLRYKIIDSLLSNFGLEASCF